MKKILNMGLTFEVPPGISVTIISPSAEDWVYLEEAYKSFTETTTYQEAFDKMHTTILKCDLPKWIEIGILAVPQGFTQDVNLGIMAAYRDTGKWLLI